jgi:hypothetical protein
MTPAFRPSAASRLGLILASEDWEIEGRIKLLKKLHFIKLTWISSKKTPKYILFLVL